MRAYFALVDDLLTWEEFEAKVGAVCKKEGDEDAEIDAARSVAESLGRLHTKIADLKPGPTLCSFFCKVIEKGDIIRFDRDAGRDSGGDLRTGAPSKLIADEDEDSDESLLIMSPDEEPPGLLRRVLVGDETGEAVLMFWDMKVHGTEDIRAGDVIEVAARFRSLSNIIAVDLQEADRDINVSLRKSGIKTIKPVNLRVKILSLNEMNSPDDRSRVYSTGMDGTESLIRAERIDISGETNINLAMRRHFTDAYVWVIDAQLSSSAAERDSDISANPCAGNMNCFAGIRIFNDAISDALKSAGEGAVVNMERLSSRPSRFPQYSAGDDSSASICCPGDDDSTFSKDFVPAEISFDKLALLAESARESESDSNGSGLNGDLFPDDSGPVSVSVIIDDAGYAGSYLRLQRKQSSFQRKSIRTVSKENGSSGFGDLGSDSSAGDDELEGAAEDTIYRTGNIFRVRRCIVSDVSGDKYNSVADGRYLESDKSARSARLVLWGNKAMIPLSKGDIVRIYNCNVRHAKLRDVRDVSGGNFRETGSNAAFEIHAGSNSCVKVLPADYVSGEIVGVIAAYPEGLCIIESESGERYSIKQSDSVVYDPGMLSRLVGCGDVKISGRISGHFIFADSVSSVSRDVSDVINRLETLEEKLRDDKS